MRRAQSERDPIHHLAYWGLWRTHVRGVLQARLLVDSNVRDHDEMYSRLVTTATARPPLINYSVGWVSVGDIHATPHSVL